MDNQKPLDTVCEHKGKFAGIGQASIPLNNKILVAASIVCGECGKITIELKVIELAGKPEPTNSIIAPDTQLSRKPRQ